LLVPGIELSPMAPTVIKIELDNILTFIGIMAFDLLPFESTLASILRRFVAP